MATPRQLLDFDNRQPTFKNKIINGGFDIWQRATAHTQSETGIFTADRWKCQTIASINTSLVTSEISSSGKAFRVQNIGSAINGITTEITQSLELANTFRDKTFTISLDIKSSANTSIVKLGQSYTVSAGAVGETSIGESIPITTSWTKVSKTFYVSNLPVSTSEDDSYVIFYISMLDLPLGETIDIANVQLEEGEIATEFEQRPIGLELNLCQRYYETRAYCYGVLNLNSGTQIQRLGISYNTKKRVIPTLALTKTGGASDVGVAFTEPSGFIASMVGAENTYVNFSFTADAEL